MIALEDRFDHFAERSVAFFGSALFFAAHVPYLLAFVPLGVLYGADAANLWLTSSLTVMTELLAVLILAAQLRESKARRLRDAEIVQALDRANNAMIHAEELPKSELDARLAALEQKDP